MSNPAVILLASLNEISGFPYRFEVEDNVGEAIHIHYKDIRLDMTISEFRELAKSLKDIFSSMVDHEKFHIEDFDAGNLVWLAEPLIDLEDIAEEEMYLEDILVDTYDEEGNVKYMSLPNSRVLKALHGDTAENDARRQINYFHPNGFERQSNQERIQFDLEQIKRYGYPRGGERILLRDDNTIIDGQHRAACLYYLYGNIKVPVRKMYFKKRDNANVNRQQDQIFYYQEQNQILRQKHFELEQQYHNLDVALNEKDRIIADYQEEQRKREEDIQKLDATINGKDVIIAQYQKDIAEKEKSIEEYQGDIAEKEKSIEGYQGDIAEKDRNIAELENEILEMQNSLLWKVTKPFRKISGSKN